MSDGASLEDVDPRRCYRHADGQHSNCGRVLTHLSHAFQESFCSSTEALEMIPVSTWFACVSISSSQVEACS